MDYGPSLINTYEIGDDGTNIAHKGIAVRLDPGPGGISRGKAWMVFEHDTLRVAAAWTGNGFIDWNGIHFNGQHQVHPRIVGDVSLPATPVPAGLIRRPGGSTTIAALSVATAGAMARCREPGADTAVFITPATR